jgi:peptidoglycan/LPS O-acetylase OafA/YrhL
MRYRKDIAGLRALAVLPILLIHAGLTAIPGGFTGVDIFCVISGYLFSRIILKEMEGDRFTLADFYRRRALRILPVLLVMLVVLAVGWWRLFPQDMRDLSWRTAATALSGSNIWFWRMVKYLGDAELTPLLHTWSRGIEEQFYIFYPLLLIALHRWLPKRIVPVLWVIVAVSLAAGFALIAVYKAAPPFTRREHVGALAQPVEVDGGEVRILGSRSNLLKALIAGATETEPGAVPSFVPKWCTRRDEPTAPRLGI